MSYIDPRGKLFGHLDRLAQLKAGLHPPPVNVEVDLSNRCGLGCRDCHFSHLHTRGPHAGQLPASYRDTGDLMDGKLLADLPHLLKGWGVRSITWTGGGEPTMHPGLARALLGAGLLMDQGLYTNGTQIDDKLASIIQQTCAWVYVSLDHATPEEYEEHKGVAAFERAVQGARRLIGGRAVVGMGFLLGPHNWRRATDMVQLGLAEIGADYVQLRPLVVTDPETPGQRAEGVDWVEHFLTDADAIRLAQADGVILDATRFQMYADWHGHGYDRCWWCSLQAVVTPDGNVWACVNRRGQPAALIGPVTSARELWVSERRRTPEPVGAGCRVLCRGHIPNLSLQDMMRERAHGNFI